MPQVQVIQPIQQQPKRLRVAAYARVSSDSEDQLNSLSVQVDYYTHLIQENPNWDFAGIYADEGITGTSTKHREQFNRLLDDCRAGLIDRVLVKSASRFARNTADALASVREMKSLGVTVPILVAQLRSADFLKFDMGKVYMMITIAILPVMIVYLLLSKYIVRGVALGSVKG